jgi:hypothetical protein
MDKANYIFVYVDTIITFTSNIQRFKPNSNDRDFNINILSVLRDVD